jgi:N-sulfoglucosamine sulfohydrolase
MLRSTIHVCALLLFVTAVNFVGASEERPNVILFIADDVSWNDYGCYGGKSARTPNIDALAANGIRFDNAYLTASSCSPSRCSIITGRYPHNNGQACELHGALPWHLVKFPALLRTAMYHTVLSGKNHMAQVKPPTDVDSAPNEPWAQLDPGRSKGNSGGHANWVSNLEDRPRDQPFFCWYASHDAHRDWDADHQWHPKAYGEKHAAAKASVPPFLVNNHRTRDDLASYENEVTRFDHFIGLTVAELKKQGVFENTLIFVMADNGRPFPRAKTRLHDSGMKTALIAHWPAGIKQPGSVSQSTVSAIDLAPTILDVAGVKAPDSFQGVSIKPIFSDPNAVTRRYAFSEHIWHDYEAFGRCVRADGFIYLINKRPYAAWQGPADSVRSPSHQSLLSIRKEGRLSPAQNDVFLTPRPATELYNMKKDPQQLNNLAGNATYKNIETRLAGLLAQWQTETGDTVPEKLTPDTFHRETGDRILKGTPRGTPPGTANRADHINKPGPIE